MAQLNEYLFDVKLMASMRVTAATPEEGAAKLRDVLECADANFGMLDDKPLLAEASYDGDFDLVEVNGVNVE